MFWRVLLLIGGTTFFIAGLDILSSADCESIDFGGTRRSATYSCVPGGTGEMSSSLAVTGMIAIGMAMLVLASWPWLQRVSTTLRAGRAMPPSGTPRTWNGANENPRGASQRPGGPRRLDPLDPILVLDLEDWTDEEVLDLAALLQREQVPHNVNGLRILIEQSSEDEVEALIDTMTPPTAELDNDLSASQSFAPNSQNPGGVSRTRDVADALRQVKLLHNEGILTDEEYEQKRTALAAQL